VPCAATAARRFLDADIEKLYARMSFTSWSATMTTIHHDAAIAARLDECKHAILEPQAAHPRLAAGGGRQVCAEDLFAQKPETPWS